MGYHFTTLLMHICSVISVWIIAGWVMAQLRDRNNVCVTQRIEKISMHCSIFMYFVLLHNVLLTVPWTETV